MEQYLTSGMYVLVNIVALVCSLVIGPRGPRQVWRYLAAGSFAMGAFGSLLWIVAYLVAADRNYSSVTTLFSAVGVVNALLNIVATALIVAALLIGRTGAAARPGAATGYEATGQQQPYQPFSAGSSVNSGYGPPGFGATAHAAAGYPTPADSPSGSGAAPYGTSGYSTPGYGTSGYSTPGYDMSGYSTPGYGTSGYPAPGQESPGFGAAH